MKQILFIFIGSISISAFSKEWKNLKQYKSITKKEQLSASDWLCKDRKSNSLTWQQANLFNLENGLANEYQTISQRRDFYLWYYKTIEAKGHTIVWPKMAYYISSKLRLIKALPYRLFIRKQIKNHALAGSEIAFKNSFSALKNILFSATIVQQNEALQWDKELLYQEQHKWIEAVYQNMDAKSLHSISRMAKGEGFYQLMVAKQIRFNGDIKDATDRYNYAVNVLREYCKNTY